jgi:hypothetical protein
MTITTLLVILGFSAILALIAFAAWCDYEYRAVRRELLDDYDLEFDPDDDSEARELEAALQKAWRDAKEHESGFEIAVLDDAAVETLKQGGA